MINASSILNRSVPVFFTLASLVSTSSNAQPQDSTDQPRQLVIRKANVPVRGVYWELPLAGVDSVWLESNKVNVLGPCDPSPGITTRCRVSRTIPINLRASNLVQVSKLSWLEEDIVLFTKGDSVSEKSVVHWGAGHSFRYGDPFDSAYRIALQYDGIADTAVLVYAFGKKGQDVHKWMTYILLTE